MMMEVMGENTYVQHHKQKIVLVLSAMRHFADALRQTGVTVDYVTLEDPDNTGELTTEMRRAVARHTPDRVMVTEPSEWRVLKMVEGWAASIGLPVEVRSDDRFFASRTRFAAWAQGRRGWRLEHFYRDMRREHAILMEGDKPAGGAWNFDAENRKPLPASTLLPSRLRFPPDETTQAVIALVGRHFSDHFGGLKTSAGPSAGKTLCGL